MKHNGKVILLAALTACLIVGIVLVGCGGPSLSALAGVYLGPDSTVTPSGIKMPIPGQRLQLMEDGTYGHDTCIPNPLYSTVPPGSAITPLTQVSYRGTYTVEGNQVVLHGEPPEAYGAFKIAGINLTNQWGVWVAHGAEWK